MAKETYMKRWEDEEMRKLENVESAPFAPDPREPVLKYKILKYKKLKILKWAHCSARTSNGMVAGWTGRKI